MINLYQKKHVKLVNQPDQKMVAKDFEGILLLTSQNKYNNKSNQSPATS